MERDARDHLRPEGAPLPDCRTCGACCFGDELWIHVVAADEERLGGAAKRLTVLVPQGRGYVARSMRMERGRCVAFGEALVDGGGCGCTIYDVRPGICREFEAGSKDCLAARSRRGVR